MNNENRCVHLPCYRFRNDKMNANEIMIRSCFLGAGERLHLINLLNMVSPVFAESLFGQFRS